MKAQLVIVTLLSVAVMVMTAVCVVVTLRALPLGSQLETYVRFAAKLSAERDVERGDLRTMVSDRIGEAPPKGSGTVKVSIVNNRYDQLFVDTYNERKAELRRKQGGAGNGVGPSEKSGAE
jgi:hypothetical protein